MMEGGKRLRDGDDDTDMRGSKRQRRELDDQGGKRVSEHVWWRDGTGVDDEQALCVVLDSAGRIDGVVGRFEGVQRTAFAWGDEGT